MKVSAKDLCLEHTFHRMSSDDLEEEQVDFFLTKTCSNNEKWCFPGSKQEFIWESNPLGKQNLKSFDIVIDGIWCYL